jgi:lipopolysaccharide export system protein LptC
MSSPTSAASRALRWSRLSRALSWAAVLVGLSFVVAFLAQAGLFASLIPSEPAVVPAVTPDQVSATESTVNGMDSENQPYEVTATRGWQDDVTPHLVHLETVNGKFRKATGVEYTLDANKGLYDTRLKTLDLQGNVHLVQKDRFTATMDKAHIVVQEKKLTSDVPVDVTFGTGKVKANGMQITDDGNRILFLNGVKAVFNAEPAKGAIEP